MYVRSNPISSHFCQKIWNINDAEVVCKRNISRFRTTFGYQNRSSRAGSNEWLSSLRTHPPRQSTYLTYDPSTKNFKKYPLHPLLRSPDNLRDGWQQTNYCRVAAINKHEHSRKTFQVLVTWSPRNAQGHQFLKGQNHAIFSNTLKIEKTLFGW